MPLRDFEGSIVDARCYRCSKTEKIWNQQTRPVVLRRGAGRRPRIRVPIDREDSDWIRSTRLWLHNVGGKPPTWNSAQSYWEIAAKRFNDLIGLLFSRYPQIHNIQPFLEQEVCASRCWNAQGHDCQCSCMGTNHGQGKFGAWLEVSDTFATRWGDQEMACRLLTKA
jgi:hypothetical protein